jgi:hypothetical protein
MGLLLLIATTVGAGATPGGSGGGGTGTVHPITISGSAMTINGNPITITT